MKGLLGFLLFALPLLVLPPAWAGDAAFMAPLAQQARLYDLEDGIAVGERGIILAAKGDQWQQQPSPVNTALLRVVRGAGATWALGHEATLLRDSVNGWQVVTTTPATDRPLFDLTFIDERHGFAVGAYGLLLVTSDGGSSWQPRALTELLNADDRSYLSELEADDPQAYADELNTILPHFNAIAANRNGVLTIVGEAGLVALSHDRGASWQPLESPYHGSFFTALWVDDDHLLIAGLRGHLYRYQLSSQQWLAIAVAGERHINRLQPLDEGRVLALGNGGQLTVVEWRTGKVHTDMVAQGPDLFAATVSDGVVTLATSAGLIRHHLVTAQ